MTDEIRHSRKFPRRKFKQQVGLLHRGSYKMVAGLEIGEGGMLTTHTNALPAGSHVCLSFFIASKGFISVMSEVVYNRSDDGSPSAGFKFLDLEFENKRHIRDYIALKSAREAQEETRS